MASIDAFFSGLTAFIILAAGYITAASCFILSIRRKSKQLLLGGFIMFFMGSFYLGLVCTWVSLLVTNQNLSEELVGQLCYFTAPLGAGFMMAFTLSLIKPKLATPVSILYALTAVIYWPAMLLFPHENITSIIPDEIGGGMIDIQLIGIVKTLVIIYILSMAVLIIPSFLWFAKRSKGKVRKKALFQATGYLIFVLGGIIEQLPISGVIAIIRLIMATGYILLYIGFT